MVSRNDLKNMLVVCQVKGNFEKQTGALSKQTFGFANRNRNQPLRKRFNLFKSDRMIEGINFGNWLIVEWQFMVNDIWFCHYSMESTAFIPVSGLCAAACKPECHKSWMKQFSCYPWRRHVNHFPSAVVGKRRNSKTRYPPGLTFFGFGNLLPANGNPNRGRNNKNRGGVWGGGIRSTEGMGVRFWC